MWQLVWKIFLVFDNPHIYFNIVIFGSIMFPRIGFPKSNLVSKRRTGE